MPTTLHTADLRIKRNDGSGYDSVVNILSSNPTAQQILSYMQPYYSQFINNTPTGVDKIIGAIAENYNPQTTYNIGDYCFYQGNLYKCISNNTTGDWHINKWDKITIKDQIDDIKENIDQLSNDISQLSSQVGGHDEYIQSLIGLQAVNKLTSVGNWNISGTTIASTLNTNITDINKNKSDIIDHESRIKNLQNQLPRSYIQSEVDRVCEEVRKIQTTDTITFIAVGGLKYLKDSTNIHEAINNMTHAINKISQQIHIDFYSNFGNLSETVSQNSQTYNNAIYQMKEATKALNKCFKNNSQIRIIGLKDAKKRSNSQVIAPNILNSFTGIYNTMINTQLSNNIIGAGYHDFQKQKIRLILINTSNYADSNHPPYSTGDLGYEQGVTIGSMLDLSQKGAEEASQWKIIILSNKSLDIKTTVQRWYKVQNIFYFYNMGETWIVNKTGDKPQYNFNNKNYAKIIGLFYNADSFLWNNFKSNNVCIHDNSTLKTILPYINLSVPSLTPDLSTGTNGKSYNKCVYNDSMMTFDRTISFSIITLDVTNQKIYSHTYGTGPDMIIHYQPLEITQQTQLTTALGGNITWNSSHTEHLENDLQNQGAAQVGAVPGAPQTAIITGMYQGYLTVWAQAQIPLNGDKNKIEIWNLKINSNQ